MYMFYNKKYNQISFQEHKNLSFEKFKKRETVYLIPTNLKK